MTVAGLMPFTRTSGASDTASSRMEMTDGGLTDVIRFAAAFCHDGVCRAGQDDARIQTLFKKDTRRLTGEKIIGRHIDFESFPIAFGRLYCLPTQEKRAAVLMSRSSPPQRHTTVGSAAWIEFCVMSISTAWAESRPCRLRSSATTASAAGRLRSATATVAPLAAASSANLAPNAAASTNNHCDPAAKWFFRRLTANLRFFESPVLDPGMPPV